MIGRRRKPFRNMDFQLLFPIAVVVVLWYLMWRLRRRTSSRVEFEPQMWGKRQLAREESALSNKEDELEIRLHEKSRDVLARIDSKLAVLQELTSRAESAAARLERALAAVQAAKDGAALGRSPLRATDETAGSVRSDEGPAGSDASRAESSRGSEFGDPLPQTVREEVRSLATYGFSLGEISQQLGIPESLVRRELAE